MRAYIRKEKIIKKGKYWWNTDKTENIFESVEVLGEQNYTWRGSASSYDVHQFLVKNESGETFTVRDSEIFFPSEQNQYHKTSS